MMIGQHIGRAEKGASQPFPWRTRLMILKGKPTDKHPYPPRFVADAMLGRLAKWLRMMGYDVTFFNDVDDLVLLRHARAESRLLLTRDRALARRAGPLGVMVHSQTLEEQLRELAERGIIHGPRDETRCPVCNTLLIAVPREEVRERVPPYVFQTQEEFYECPDCCRIYWAGTHWQNVTRTWATLGWREDE